MPNLTETYLEKHFDNFEFFIPGCKDRRFREINQRTKFCMQCKGFEACKTYPHFWLEGSAQRLVENEKYAIEEAARPKPPAPAPPPVEEEEADEE